MLSICHDAIRDRQITNRTADESMKGVSMSTLKEGGGSSQVHNPLTGLQEAVHRPTPAEEMTVAIPPPKESKISLADRLSANAVHGLVVVSLMAYVDEI